MTGLAVAGCLHTDFTNKTDMVLAARPSDCHVEIVFDGPPKRPYVVLGPVWTSSSSPQLLYGLRDSDAEPIQRLIDQACLAGAHGLMSVAVHTDRPIGKGWRHTNASAVAFVYVDPSGRVLPPPDGPRVAIPLSAFQQ